MTMKRTVLTAAILALTLPSFAQLTLKPDNIDQIIKEMTLEEKAIILVGGGNTKYKSGGPDYTVGFSNAFGMGAAGTTAKIQRLGIPPTVLADGPAGVRISPTRKNDSRTYYATAFPVGVCLASSWNAPLVEEVGEAMGNEVLEYGVDVLLAPGMNIHRNPLCGRTFEYFSEDPLLTGKVAAAYVRGIQKNGVGTSIKHFAVNSQETNRLAVNEVVSPRALREIYLKGFEIAVKEGKPWTVMSSYNRLNGKFTQEDKELLTTILRDEWGFDGIVMTDWTGLRNTAAQVMAGNDLMESGRNSQVEDIVAKVKSGVLPIEDVDRCVKRVLQYIVRTPRFNKYKFSNTPDLKAHAGVSRRAGAEGIILLKNEGNTLPLAVNDTVSLFGPSAYDIVPGGTGSGFVNRKYKVSLDEGLANSGVTPEKELADLYKAYNSYYEARKMAELPPKAWRLGRPAFPEIDLTRAAIDRQAKNAGTAVITIGRQAGEGSDRRMENDFLLSENERNLITNVCESFHKEGKKVVVVLNIGAPIETASWKSLPDAIVLAWQPGQEAGNAIADVLTGKETPSGKLPMTLPIALADHPSTKDFPVVDADRYAEKNVKKRNFDYTLHNEGINVGYRHFKTNAVPVSYPFGYGLSYTTFSYDKPVVKATKDGFKAYVTVKNTGKRAGKEVVELYVTAPGSDIPKPAEELKAFAKTKTLQPGESQTLEFSVSDYDLASFHEKGSKWVADKGAYDILFGTSSDNILARATYKLPKEKSWPVNEVLLPDMAVEK